MYMLGIPERLGRYGVGRCIDIITGISCTSVWPHGGRRNRALEKVEHYL